MFRNADKKHFLDDKESIHVTNHGPLSYPHKLNFYDKPPLYEVTVEEFETYALDRLRILAEIESSAARNRTWDELKKIIKEQCFKYLPLNSNSAQLIDRDSERRKDHLGHFVLRLAFCRSEELRRRFVKAELMLFKIRYDEDDRQEKQAFLSSRKFNWIAVDEAEKAAYKEYLLAFLNYHKPEADTFDKEKYFKVKWRTVPDLVEKRKVFLKGGWAYVPGKEQSSIVFQEFEVHLIKALEMTARILPRLDEDSRLLPILDNLSQGFLAGVPSDWVNSGDTGNGEGIKAEMVDDLAKKHFPLCMRNMHDKLRTDHHLKHFGRLNYGLFLKVLGLSIDEAMVFWRKSFDRIPDDKFDKEYKYNIRHSFGLEGKRANYAAKSCQQLLTNSDHGCPYRYHSLENLSTALLSSYSSHGLKAADMPEIIATVKAGHYHVACTRVFEMTHSSFGVRKGDGVGDGESVTHPNQYAAKSMEFCKPAQEGAAEAMVVD